MDRGSTVSRERFDRRAGVDDASGGREIARREPRPREDPLEPRARVRRARAGHAEEAGRVRRDRVVVVVAVRLAGAGRAGRRGAVPGRRGRGAVV